jgi:choline transport protein
MTEKTFPHAPPILVSDVSSDPDAQSLTSDDRLVMQQMGKRQQLKRRFTGLSIFGLSITLLSSYEALGMSLAVAMTAGGPVSLVYGMLFVFAGTMALAASIAEMASICPISGAQMHWTYMFAPKEWRVGVTFIQGTLALCRFYVCAFSLTYA